MCENFNRSVALRSEEEFDVWMDRLKEAIAYVNSIPGYSIKPRLSTRFELLATMGLDSPW